MRYKAVKVKASLVLFCMQAQIILTMIALFVFPKEASDKTVLLYTIASILVSAVFPFWCKISSNFKRPYTISLIIPFCVFSISGISIWAFGYAGAFIVFCLYCVYLNYYCGQLTYSIYVRGGKIVYLQQFN